MMLLWLLLMAQLAWPTSALYHEKSLKVFQPGDLKSPLRKEANFGFSIAYQSATQSLIISAPTADYIGRIYSCDIELKRNCTVVPYDIKRDDPLYNHDYWLGATVKAGPDYFVTCAPRYVEVGSSYNLPGEFSHCYRSSKHSKLLPISQISSQQRRVNTKKFEDEMDSFGWSMDLKDRKILFGGPAMFSGRAMASADSAITSISGHSKGVDVKYNLGYSVAIGAFFSDKIVYAVGSPFGQNGRGKVVFFNKDWKVMSSISHKNIGTMFGAVLATAHIFSDSLTDLLVGAPTEAANHDYDTGAVYYYKTGSRRSVQMSIEHTKIISGYQPGSLFGSAIISVGDLNGDGKDEIAIAAPYEDEGKGAVYLYCGSSFLDASSNVLLQRLQPEGLHTFGLSLSSPSDYDENGCNELAIGAPQDNAVVLYKCLASVVLTVFAVFPNLRDRRNVKSPYPDRNETYFVFDSCFDVKYPKKLKTVIAKIEVTVQIKHPDATLAMPHKDGKYNVTLDIKKTRYCEKIGVSTPEHGNYNIKIFYNIQARLVNSPINETDFDGKRVILSGRSELSISDNVWAAECKVQNACKADLSLKIATSPRGSYMIGSMEPIKVNMILENKGEIAYDACVELQLEGAAMKKTPTTSCTHHPLTNTLKCAPSYALKTDKSWETTDIILKTETLTNKNKQINLTSRLYEHCTDPATFKEQNYTITVLANSEGITVNGKTNIGDVVSMTTLEVTDSGKQFQHNYMIQNDGITWEDVTCEIILPKLPYVNYPQKAVTVFIQQNSFECNMTDDLSPDYITANCKLSSIKQNIITFIIVLIQVPPTTLDDILYKQNVTIKSTLKLHFDDGDKTYSVATEVMLRDTGIPWWIILLAALIGLLILIILILILRQYGFLKRKERKKLQELRKSVRRQTVRRSMMQQQVEDRQRLTDVPIEATETDVPCGIEPDHRVEVNIK
ncbi:integrin alpha-PS2 [Manduca sexta]|uniref:Hemocyte-specific integrin alpha subunit 1 n=1 Tax=Manduca sexta TaxID=7130 RepID=Q1G0S7_MANSE|nr:integrin alpha-PS2 [Manduca sexta]ABF59518.1 hemocyte-specific integrin alpha subunit 1 [Manduca sexta]